MPADCPLRHGPGELLEHRQVENPVVLPRRQCHSDQWFAVAVIRRSRYRGYTLRAPARSQRVPRAPSQHVRSVPRNGRIDLRGSSGRCHLPGCAPENPLKRASAPRCCCELRDGSTPRDRGHGPWASTRVSRSPLAAGSHVNPESSRESTPAARECPGPAGHSASASRRARVFGLHVDALFLGLDLRRRTTPLLATCGAIRLALKRTIRVSPVLKSSCQSLPISAFQCPQTLECIDCLNGPNDAGTAPRTPISSQLAVDPERGPLGTGTDSMEPPTAPTRETCPENRSTLP